VLGAGLGRGAARRCDEVAIVATCVELAWSDTDHCVSEMALGVRAATFRSFVVVFCDRLWFRSSFFVRLLDGSRIARRLATRRRRGEQSVRGEGVMHGSVT
jgi:hypothetical protein